jgi:hypothetical protein
MLVVHIIIALTSLAAAVLALARPSQKIVHANYALIAGTLLSGTVLVMQGYSLLHMCSAGLAYSLLTMTMVLVAQKRVSLPT